MTAIDILVEEHNVILSVLACLEKMIAEAEVKQRLNASTARSAIDFFRNFADGCHHAKEEDCLFVAMEERGFPRHGGPTGVMLMEHVEGRRLVTGMADAIDKAADGDGDAIRKFSQNGKNFIDLLRQHIQKENMVLFPMADQAFEREKQDSMLVDFKEIEANAGGQRHAQYIEIARQLCKQYGVDFDENSQVATIKREFSLPS